EVLLENTELILEAFDYLQFPFALKQGRVGKLSIKIPWKKLGREPIIIILEDVFISASQRSEEEWSLDAVERREFAGKKAKLAAAELAKLSSRMCGELFQLHLVIPLMKSMVESLINLREISKATLAFMQF
ncbi:vacuolar protein sorting-associated protein 13-like, partial [Carica papaya]|uniref:vacuolar protein sorting-associated protein 13-like n=1 Tax=Carica papaya TaxID=3649 RepID=UPI000B8CF7D0